LAAKPEEYQKDDKIVLSANKYESAETTCRVDWVSEMVGARRPAIQRIWSAAEDESRRKKVANTIHLSTDAGHMSLGSDFGSLRGL
jgi:hypothetical protein